MTAKNGSDLLASQYADVVRGVPVDESPHVSTAEDRVTYAELEVEVAELRRRFPGVEFEIPNEIPSAFPTSSQ